MKIYRREVEVASFEDKTMKIILDGSIMPKGDKYMKQLEGGAYVEAILYGCKKKMVHQTTARMSRTPFGKTSYVNLNREFKFPPLIRRIFILENHQSRWDHIGPTIIIAL